MQGVVLHDKPRLPLASTTPAIILMVIKENRRLRDTRPQVPPLLGGALVIVIVVIIGSHGEKVSGVAGEIRGRGFVVWNVDGVEDVADLFKGGPVVGIDLETTNQIIRLEQQRVALSRYSETCIKRPHVSQK